MRPVPGRLNSPRAWRTRKGKREYHAGWDLAAEQGDDVCAPAAGVVVARWTNDTTKPYSRYGPAGVVILDGAGVRHLLAHLQDDAALAPMGATVAEGDVVGTVSHLRHVHWETRVQDVPRRGQTNEDITIDPGVWLAEFDNDPTAPAPPAESSSPLPSGGGGLIVAALLLLALRPWRHRR